MHLNRLFESLYVHWVHWCHRLCLTLLHSLIYSPSAKLALVVQRESVFMIESGYRAHSNRGLETSNTLKYFHINVHVFKIKFTGHPVRLIGRKTVWCARHTNTAASVGGIFGRHVKAYFTKVSTIFRGGTRQTMCRQIIVQLVNTPTR